MDISSRAKKSNFHDRSSQFRRRMVIEALTGRTFTEAAVVLDIPRSSLYCLCQRLGIDHRGLSACEDVVKDWVLVTLSGTVLKIESEDITHIEVKNLTTLEVTVLQAETIASLLVSKRLRLLPLSEVFRVQACV